MRSFWSVGVASAEHEAPSVRLNLTGGTGVAGAGAGSATAALRSAEAEQKVLSGGAGPDSKTAQLIEASPGVQGERFPASSWLHSRT